MTDTVASAIEERISGSGPGRTRAFAAAIVIGFAAAAAAYKLLRSGDDHPNP